MYKLVFADDERLVLHKITRMMDWESAGFALAGCCSNGYELMELVEKELPDLVILDINMPFISGLEAARQIRHSYPHIRLVFLTGYMEFEYAQQAVELGALKYIVKPVSAQELQKVLQGACAALDEENSRIRKMAELEQLYQSNRQVLIEDLLSEHARSDAIYDRAHAYGLDWSKETFFQAAVLSVDRAGHAADWAANDEKTMLYALCNVTAELAQEAGLGLACIRKGLVVLIGFSPSGSQFARMMQEFVESVLHTVACRLAFTATAGLGTVCRSCAQVAASCSEALRTMQICALEGGNRLYTGKDLQGCAGGHVAVWDAVNYIEASYADPNLSADAVCEHLHLSPSYLRALFKKQTGGTIIGYITKARMERARTLLENGTEKNSRIAEKVGYTDPHYFNYCFKRYFGVSPNELRKNRLVL